MDLNGLSAVSVSPQRPPEKCRYAVGSVLCEGEEKPDEELQKMYEKFGFKVFSLPEVSHTVTTAFPCTTSLSYVLGAYRVYPKLSSYIEVRSLLRQRNPNHRPSTSNKWTWRGVVTSDPPVYKTYILGVNVNFQLRSIQLDCPPLYRSGFPSMIHQRCYRRVRKVQPSLHSLPLPMRAD